MDAEIVTCGRCRGKGHYGSDPNHICEGCGGSGHVRVASPATQCGRCRGKGHYGSDPNHICEGCSGCGYFRG